MSIREFNNDKYIDNQWCVKGKIENEGFNTQKNQRDNINHAKSVNYNAMRCHYLVIQIADILLQLYDNWK